MSQRDIMALASPDAFTAAHDHAIATGREEEFALRFTQMLLKLCGRREPAPPSPPRKPSAKTPATTKPHWSDFVGQAHDAAVAELGPYYFQVHAAPWVVLAPAECRLKMPSGTLLKWAPTRRLPHPRYWPEGTFPNCVQIDPDRPPPQPRTDDGLPPGTHLVPPRPEGLDFTLMTFPIPKKVKSASVKPP